MLLSFPLLQVATLHLMGITPDGPLQISALIDSLACGAFHCCALINTTKKIKCWGNNGSGQLGYGDTNNRGDMTNEMGKNLPAVDLGSLGINFPKEISLGGAHTCIIFTNQSVKCWGSNTWGQLGLGDATNRGDKDDSLGDKLPFLKFGKSRKLMKLLSNARSNCVLFEDGKVACFGYNLHGELGIGNNIPKGANPNDMDDNLQLINFGENLTVDSIHLGSSAWHACIIANNGYGVKCWGYNYFGQLGYPDLVDRGDNENEMGESLPFVDINLLKRQKILNVFVGYSHSCMILDDASTRCFGSNLFGQFGTGSNEKSNSVISSSPTNWGNGLHTRIISMGEFFMCGLLSNSAIKCVGKNDVGQLGQGDTLNRGRNAAGDNLLIVSLGSSHWVRNVSSGNAHSCLLLDNYRVKCFGMNDHPFYNGGYLGLGDTNNRGDEANEMGDFLPYLSIESEDEEYRNQTSNPQTDLIIGLSISLPILLGSITGFCCYISRSRYQHDSDSIRKRDLDNSDKFSSASTPKLPAEIKIFKTDEFPISLLHLVPENEAVTVNSLEKDMGTGSPKRSKIVFLSFIKTHQSNPIQKIIQMLKHVVESNDTYPFELQESSLSDGSSLQNTHLQIKRSMAFLVILTKSYVKNPYCMMELHLAIQCGVSIIGIYLPSNDDDSFSIEVDKALIEKLSKDTFANIDELSLLEMQEYSININQMENEFLESMPKWQQFHVDISESDEKVSMQMQTILDSIQQTPNELAIS